ncbi:MAG: hypothetical protein JOY78_09825 [Pseudonocardia sp.]|nr:hypothetical protein [Pseudonocardia sp.]
MKLRGFGLSGDTLDEVLLSLRQVAADQMLARAMHPYEAEMLNDVVVGLALTDAEIDALLDAPDRATRPAAANDTTKQSIAA